MSLGSVGVEGSEAPVSAVLLMNQVLCHPFQAPCHLCLERAGVLLGIAIRTGSPLSLSLAEPVWKQLAGMSLTIADLSEVTARRGRAVWATPQVLSQSRR